MNIAICEDLSADANLLQRYIKQYFAQIHADCDIYTYNTGAGFLAEFSNCLYGHIYGRTKRGRYGNGTENPRD